MVQELCKGGGKTSGIVKIEKPSTFLCKKFSSVPVRCGNNSCANSYSIRKSSAGDLCLIKIGGNIYIGGMSVSEKVRFINIFIKKFNMFLHLKVFDKAHKEDPVFFT